MPLLELISAKFKFSKENEAFASKLSELLYQYSDRIPLWIHGHSHDFIDKDFISTRFIRNPLGYLRYDEEKNFKNNFTVDV